MHTEKKYDTQNFQKGVFVSYSKKRYLAYMLITIFVFATPFITIDGNHLLLLSFEKLQFHILGSVFDVNEFFLMPFLVMFFFMGIFALTAIYGRIWCGWACPQTIFRVIYRDLIEGSLLDYRSIKNKQKDNGGGLLKRITALTLLGVISIVAASNFIWYFVPPEEFFIGLQNPDEHLVLIGFIVTIALFLLFDIAFLKESFCAYVCPYSRIQMILYDDNTKHVVYDTGRGAAECTECEACVKICPAHIDIKKGLQLECINCLECSDACSKVMAKQGSSSLIRWGSTNSVFKGKVPSLFSKKNIAYFTVLLLSIIGAAVMGSKKEEIIVNVNKTAELYKIHEDSSVSNNYTLTVHNTQNVGYTYNVEAENKEFFEVKKLEPFGVKAQSFQKKVLVLQTKKKLVGSDRQSTPMVAKIVVFAKENPNIRLTKELAFIYPRSDLVK